MKQPKIFLDDKEESYVNLEFILARDVRFKAWAFKHFNMTIEEQIKTNNLLKCDLLKKYRRKVK